MMVQMSELNELKLARVRNLWKIYPYIFMLLWLLDMLFFSKWDYSIEIDPEYSNGILTASSIVFVCCTLLYSREPSKSRIPLGVIFGSIGWLLFGVIAIYFTAIYKLPQVFVLGLLVFGFILNIILLVFSFLTVQIMENE